MHVAAGASHSLVRGKLGEVYAWGSNSHGQLGDGSTQDSLRPKKIISEGIRALAAGRRHSLAVSDSGEVLAWGSNEGGLLGTGFTSKQLLPAKVIAEGARAVAAGESHSLALTESGEVFAWGENRYGQLGDGSTSARRQPVRVGLSAKVCHIAAGWHHSLAVSVLGEVFAWGFNTPDRTPPGFRPASVPTMVIGSGIRSVAAGGVHSLALTDAGTIVVWGGNDHGQLGDGTTERRTWPVPLPGSWPPFIRVAAGSYQSLAITDDSEVFFWGSSMTGPRLLPAGVHFEDGGFAAAGGGVHSVVVGADGAVLAWGGNTYGQVGDGSTVDRDSPKQALGPNVVEIKTREMILAELLAGPAEVEDVAAKSGARGPALLAAGRAIAGSAGAGAPAVPKLLVQMTGRPTAPRLVLRPPAPASHGGTS